MWEQGKVIVFNVGTGKMTCLEQNEEQPVGETALSSELPELMLS